MLKSYLYIILISILFLVGENCFSQKFLRITRFHFKSAKNYEIYVGDIMKFKLKGEYCYHSKKITNLQDSIILFKDTSIITLSQIKSIKIARNNRIIGLFQGVFISAGVLFFIVDTSNHLINDEHPIVNKNVAIIGASFISVGILISRLNIKKINNNNRTAIKIIDLPVTP